MMDGVMGETHLEFGIKNLQLGANLIHRTLVHLHLIDEFGDLIGWQWTVVETYRFQSRLQFAGIDAALSIKYHGSIVYPKGAWETEKALKNVIPSIRQHATHSTARDGNPCR